MFKVKALLLLLILALAAACADQKTTKPAVAVADNEENRTAAAKQYLEVMPPKDMLDDLTSKVVQQMPEKGQKLFASAMASPALQDAMYQITLKALVKHFTVNELKAQTAFYSSPEGKSSRRKFGEYMADIMPQVNMEVVKAFQQVQKEQQEKEGPKVVQPPAKPGEPKLVQPQTKPAEPKAPQAQPKPAEPPAPKAPPEKKAPQAPKAQPESPGK